MSFEGGVPEAITAKEIADAVQVITATVDDIGSLDQRDKAAFFSALRQAATSIRNSDRVKHLGLVNVLIGEAIKNLALAPASDSSIFGRLERAFAMTFPDIPGGVFRRDNEESSR